MLAQFCHLRTLSPKLPVSEAVAPRYTWESGTTAQSPFRCSDVLPPSRMSSANTVSSTETMIPKSVEMHRTVVSVVKIARRKSRVNRTMETNVTPTEKARISVVEPATISPRENQIHVMDTMTKKQATWRLTIHLMCKCHPLVSKRFETACRCRAQPVDLELQPRPENVSRLVGPAVSYHQLSKNVMRKGAAASCANGKFAL